MVEFLHRMSISAMDQSDFYRAVLHNSRNLNATVPLAPKNPRRAGWPGFEPRERKFTWYYKSDGSCLTPHSLAHGPLHTITIFVFSLAGHCDSFAT